jgi:hypothetical protein
MLYNFRSERAVMGYRPSQNTRQRVVYEHTKSRPYYRDTFAKQVHTTNTLNQSGNPTGLLFVLLLHRGTRGPEALGTPSNWREPT